MPYHEGGRIATGDTNTGTALVINACPAEAVGAALFRNHRIT